MRFLFGFSLVVGSLCGLVLSFMADITVVSTLQLVNGQEMSTWLLAFSIVALINGLMVLFIGS
ncbi:MAG: hypothetical protein PHR43_07205 [Dehalococcoidales bacterium]|nr:hypothetical protein [Dehalococcoidales bacterium]